MDNLPHPKQRNKAGSAAEFVVQKLLESYQIPAVRNCQLGRQPNGSKHYPDLVATTSKGEKVAISVKTQNGPGSAQDKLARELDVLCKLIQDGHAARGYLVLCGEWWFEHETTRQADRVFEKRTGALTPTARYYVSGEAASRLCPSVAGKIFCLPLEDLSAMLTQNYCAL
jgi:hypothetical protein